MNAVELHEEAKRATNAGRHERALALGSRARTRTADPDLLALLDGTAAYAEGERGRLTHALDLCSRALGRPTSQRVRGIVLGQRALILMRQGRVDAAFTDFDDAITLVTEDPEHRGRFLLNRGNLHLERGDVAASADFAAAMADFDAAGLPTQRAKTEHNVGYTLMLTGDLVGAIKAMRSAATELGALSPVSRAIGLMDHAEALFLAGLATEAEAELRTAIILLTQAGARRPAAEAQHTLAKHLASDDPGAAAKLAATAARAFRDMGAERSALAAESLALACRLALGRPVEAAAEEMLADLRDREMTLDCDYLELHLHAARLAAGRVAELDGVSLSQPTNLRDRMLAADVGARHAAASGQPGAALGMLRSALDEAQAMRARVGSLDLATTLSNHTRRLSRQGLALAVASGDPMLVLEWSERGRAHASRIVPVRPHMDLAATEQLARLRHLALTGADGAQLAELLREVREEAWTASEGGVAVAVCDPGALRAELDAADAALIAYLLVEGRVIALVVAAEVAMVDCGPAARVTDLLAGVAADLDGAASVWGGLRGAVRASLLEGVGRLSDLLVAPVLDRVGARWLALTPSDPFHLVPWGCLPGLRGRPLTVAPSATAWLRRRTVGGWLGARPRPARVVSVAGPRLPHTSAEALAVGERWPGAVVLRGEEATVAAVLGAFGAADIAHLAAHGHHYAENPLFSRLELVDGPLFGYALAAVANTPALVVLSACDVGASAVRGDDLLGLPTALLYGGVGTVVAAVSRVGDAAAREVSLALHARLSAGYAPAEALAHALVDVDEEHVAPFVCFGVG